VGLRAQQLDKSLKSGLCLSGLFLPGEVSSGLRLDLLGGFEVSRNFDLIKCTLRRVRLAGHLFELIVDLDLGVIVIENYRVAC